jgi:hypothetical protein
MFDWRQQLAAADTIIQCLAVPKVGPRQTRKGLDLTKKREKIARLLAEVMEIYIVEYESYQARSDPSKPSQDQGENHAAPTLVCNFDYSEFANDCIDDQRNWDKHWRETYGRGAGNPGKSRKGKLPVAPAHAVYLVVRNWWRAEGLGRFSPTLQDFNEPGEECDETQFNPPSRFLLSVLRYVDAGYTIENARGLYETLRDRKSPAK